MPSIDIVHASLAHNRRLLGVSAGLGLRPLYYVVAQQRAVMANNDSRQVYCHRCTAAWHHHQHGLTCPNCRDDFTQIIEARHDPRNEDQDAEEDDPNIIRGMLRVHRRTLSPGSSPHLEQRRRRWRGGSCSRPSSQFEHLHSQIDSIFLYYDDFGPGLMRNAVVPVGAELRGAVGAPGPAAEAAIEALPQRSVPTSAQGEDGKAMCSICLDEVPLGRRVTALPCSHWFHFECIRHWLARSDSCPICRCSITRKEPLRRHADTILDGPEQARSRMRSREDETPDRPASPVPARAKRASPSGVGKETRAVMEARQRCGRRQKARR